MDRTAYLTRQLAEIERAIALGRLAKANAASIHELYSTRDPNTTDDIDYSEDTFKYFDTNDAQGQVEQLQMQINDLKAQMIRIKTANDQLLLDGGFLPCIDREIADIFLTHTLCRLKARDVQTPAAIEDTVQALCRLRDEMAALL